MKLFKVKIKITNDDDDFEHYDELSVVALDGQDAREKLKAYAKNYKNLLGDNLTVYYDTLELKEAFIIY